jgi:hypothetical protein
MPTGHIYLRQQCACLDLTPFCSVPLTSGLQWDAVEDKPTVLLYGGGAVVALWLTSVVVGAINAVPLVCSVPCPSGNTVPGVYIIPVQFCSKLR